MRKTKLYKAIAQILDAHKRCVELRNTEWVEKHGETLGKLVDLMPSGSGIDAGTKLDRDKSTADKLVFTTSFHHMHESGVYDGWTEHTVTVRPSLAFDILLTISGPNRNDIKEYLHDVYRTALTDEIEF